MFNENDKATKPGARAQQKQATASAVLAAAREEFERVGYEAASLRAIAARAGVSAGTVIHHHGDKRELLHAALFDDLDAAIARAVAGVGAPPLEKQLGRLTRTVFAYYQKRPALSRTLLKESLFADPPWAGRFTAQVASLHGVIARLGTAAGVDGVALGLAYFSFFYFALIAWVQGAHAQPVKLVEQLVAQHLDGLRPKAPRRAAKEDR